MKAYCDEHIPPSLMAEILSVISFEDIEMDDSCRRLWSKLEIMITAPCKGKHRRYPLHCVAAFADCPIYIIKLALAYRSSCIEEVDESRKLPLHIVAASSNHENTLGFVECLLRKNPDSARAKDSDGNTPFSLAVLSKNDFLVVDRLLTDPNLLRERHSRTGLFPFMFAASVATDEVSLFTSYKLLLKDPSVLSY